MGRQRPRRRVGQEPGQATRWRPAHGGGGGRDHLLSRRHPSHCLRCRLGSPPLARHRSQGHEEGPPDGESAGGSSWHLRVACAQEEGEWRLRMSTLSVAGGDSFQPEVSQEQAVPGRAGQTVPRVARSPLDAGRHLVRAVRWLYVASATFTAICMRGRPSQRGTSQCAEKVTEWTAPHHSALPPTGPSGS